MLAKVPGRAATSLISDYLAIDCLHLRRSTLWDGIKERDKIEPCLETTAISPPPDHPGSSGIQLLANPITLKFLHKRSSASKTLLAITQFPITLELKKILQTI